MTLKLLTTSEGKKMGKTEKGAVWLDPAKTTPYEFFQYWRNIEDVKTEECLGLLTFLPMEEVKRLGALEGALINEAKEVLAFELTKTIHGEEEAKKALEASKALFAGGQKTGSIPSTTLSSDLFTEGLDPITLLVDTGIVPSRSEGRRIIQQGGLKINEIKITDINHKVTLSDFIDNAIMIQKGKKVFHQVKL
jgi:tyrosyl-tRNA synthetase